MVFGQACGAGEQNPVEAITKEGAIPPAGIDIGEGSGVETKAWVKLCLTLALMRKNVCITMA